ncbi:SecY-interacting protein [Corallincola platygyrae]|uniref:Protein Syd n=1 Tax=Corallincola platygyrae TaxID=1193278 RepID=A0ABW4XTH9_9GAMM
MSDMNKAIDSFFNRLIEQPDLLPQTHWDPKWPSPCIQGKPEQAGEVCRWLPVKREQPASFDNVENAIELAIHVDVKQLYQNYYSNIIPAQFGGLALDLIQPWNDEDFEGLQENLIGHVLMKKRLNQSITLFIGCIDDDTIVSVENDTGRVVKERVGCEPASVLADSLVEFVSQLRLRS